MQRQHRCVHYQEAGKGRPGQARTGKGRAGQEKKGRDKATLDKFQPELVLRVTLATHLEAADP